MDKQKKSLIYKIIIMTSVTEIITYDIVASPGFTCATISVNIVSESEALAKLNNEKMLSRNEKIDILLS